MALLSVMVTRSNRKMAGAILLIAPPFARLVPTTRPLVSDKSGIVKSPLVAVILKIRELCWASIVSTLLAGAVDRERLLIVISPNTSESSAA